MCQYDLTLIVPSHNRHGYLERTVAYYSGLRAAVAIYDSSAEPYCGPLAENIVYRHVPGMGFVEKMALAAASEQTRFVACCPDDDFILHSSLYEGVKFLSDHPDYKSYVGRYLAFNEGELSFFEIYDHRRTRSAESGSPAARAREFFGNYVIMLWGLFDRGVLAEAYGTLSMLKLNNDNFIEIVIAAVACARGKLKVSDTVWGVREINPGMHWGVRQKPLTTFLSDSAIRSDFIKVQGNLDRITQKGYATTTMTWYLVFCLKAWARATLLCRAFAKASRLVFGGNVRPALCLSPGKQSELTMIQRQLGRHYAR